MPEKCYPAHWVLHGFAETRCGIQYLAVAPKGPPKEEYNFLLAPPVSGWWQMSDLDLGAFLVALNGNRPPHLELPTCFVRLQSNSNNFRAVWKVSIAQDDKKKVTSNIQLDPDLDTSLCHPILKRIDQLQKWLGYYILLYITLYYYNLLYITMVSAAFPALHSEAFQQLAADPSFVACQGYQWVDGPVTAPFHKGWVVCSFSRAYGSMLSYRFGQFENMHR